MKVTGNADFVSARKSEAQGDFPASWWVTLLDEEGAGEWYAPVTLFASEADVPERLASVEVEFSLNQRDRKAKVRVVSLKVLATAQKR